MVQKKDQVKLGQEQNLQVRDKGTIYFKLQVENCWENIFQKQQLSLPLYKELTYIVPSHLQIAANTIIGNAFEMGCPSNICRGINFCKWRLPNTYFPANKGSGMDQEKD